MIALTSLKDSLVIRAGELLTDTTYAPLVPHGALEGVGQIIGVGMTIVVVLIVGAAFYGLYTWLR